MFWRLNHNAALTALFLSAAPSSLAQTPEGVDYAAPDTDVSRDRLLRYRAGALEPERDAGSKPPPEIVTASSAADAGVFVPYSLSPRIVAGHAWSRAVGGYDTAGKVYRVRASAESSVTTYLAIRVDFEHGPSTTTMDRVSLGARLQLLNQKAHGIDMSTGAFYQPNDFRGEGNVVGGVMIGRAFGRFAVFGNLLIGSDPEGDDQELDGRLGMLIRANHVLQLGWDGRYRLIVSTDQKRIGGTSVDWELGLLPNAVWTFGSAAIVGEAGFSALQQTAFDGQVEQRRSMRAGFLAMGGVGVAF